MVRRLYDAVDRYVEDETTGKLKITHYDRLSYDGWVAQLYLLHLAKQVLICRLQRWSAGQHGGLAAGRMADVCSYSFAGEQVERPVSGPLRVGRPYGYHIIVSSTSAVPLALDVLAQVPQVLHWLRSTRNYARLLQSCMICTVVRMCCALSMAQQHMCEHGSTWPRPPFVHAGVAAAGAEALCVVQPHQRRAIHIVDPEPAILLSASFKVTLQLQPVSSALCSIYLLANSQIHH